MDEELGLTATAARPVVGGWNLANADRFKLLEAQGVDPQSAWKMTGTWRGSDGRLRQRTSATGFGSVDYDFQQFDPNIPTPMTQPETTTPSTISPPRPNLIPTLPQLGQAFERRVMPVATEAVQTLRTGGILGDILRQYGESSVLPNQAMMQAFGRPFQQIREAPEPPSITTPTAFRPMGDPFQRALGQEIGDPLNIFGPGVLQGTARAGRAIGRAGLQQINEAMMTGEGFLGRAMAPVAPRRMAQTPTDKIVNKIEEGRATAKTLNIPANQLDRPASEVVLRGQNMPPRTPPPTQEQLAAARADTRMGADIVGQRLDIIVPEQERVAGGVYRAGRPDGGKWSDLSLEELSSRGPGFNGTNNDLDRLWNESLSEVSQAARDSVARTGATWKAFDADKWNIAFSLPLRNQLWYELSGEAYVSRLPDTSLRELLVALDLTGATSARAEPGENLERTIAILSQRMRDVPVDVDVTIPSTVAAALKRSGENISSDLANKTGMFADTIALTGGVPVRYPISVNDVWEAKTYGITDDQLSANQPLHEVFAKYINKVRDFHNQTSPEQLFPHQSWNVQARKWVTERSESTGVDPFSIQGGSDYAAEFDNIVKKLEAAGISVPNGQLTREVLLDPRTADALRTKTKGFREAPKATVEFGTLLTPSGKLGAQIYEQAKSAGDDLTAREYRQILTSAMYQSARGKPTAWENLVRVATNRAENVTRIYSPTSFDPFSVSGTFQGAASPNIRIPFKNMTPEEIAYANAVAGRGLKQKAMAAAEIRRLDLDQELPQGFVPTNSIKFAIDGPVPEQLLVDVTKKLGDGFEVSAMRYPDAIVLDVNPRFGDAGPEPPTAEAIDKAIEMLQEQYNAKNVKAFRAAYRSEYGKNYVEDPGDGSEYEKIIKQTLKGWNNEAIKSISELAGKSASKSDISKFLAGEFEKLPIDPKQLPEGVQISSISGRAQTIRKGLRQRISDHNAAIKAFETIGNGVDQQMASAIPKWQKREDARKKRASKQQQE